MSRGNLAAAIVRIDIDVALEELAVAETARP
jgi:hypothetical protein